MSSQPILVVLIVGGFVLFLVTNAAHKSNVSDAGDPGADQNSLGIVGSDDETPAGDTSEHAAADDARSGARSRREDEPPGRRAGPSSAAKRRANGPRADILDALRKRLSSCWFELRAAGKKRNVASNGCPPLSGWRAKPSSSVNGAPTGAPFALRRPRG